MAASNATVEHPITKHCPILMAGDISPQTLLVLENAFSEYFIAKSIVEAHHVKHILGAFKCVHICDWISDHTHLLTLSFDAFMHELRANYLPSDWIETIRSNLLGM